MEALRAKVSCEAVLEQAGYELDGRESTRRAVKYRHGGNIIIVTHDGRGWFDPLSDEKGDVFALAMFLDKVTFPVAAEAVAELDGFRLSRPEWTSPRSSGSAGDIEERWRRRRTPSPGSDTWRYLCWERGVPPAIVRHAIREDILREGPYGSMWAAHVDSHGGLVGWEERGPDWRGFASGGSKMLFRLGPINADRLCVTEAAIDAMSLAALEGSREGTLYLSTGGGWSPATDAALCDFALRPGLTLVAATDANFQGDIYAERLRALAEASGCGWQRLRPPADDWNEVLKGEEREKREIMENRMRPAACAPAASREASPGKSRPLTQPDTRPAERGGDEGLKRRVRSRGQRRLRSPNPERIKLMASMSLPRKVFQGVAKRNNMFLMFDRHARRPDRFASDQSATYAGEWFEIGDLLLLYARYAAAALDAWAELCNA